MTYSPQALIVELSDVAPVERPPLEIAETMDAEDKAGDDAAVEEAAVDVNRSPDSMSETKKDGLKKAHIKETV